MNNSLYYKHILSISDLNKNELEQIVQTAEKLENDLDPDLLKGKLIASCFFEPSTRTRLSFEAAVLRLGGRIIGFDDGGNISLTKKGETLVDSIKVIASYVDAIVMRHPQEGSARLASEMSSVPVINGGDGANQHPTQTLTDLYSIYKCQGKLEDLTITCVGDLKYGRTVHSLTQAMSLFNANFVFVSPEALAMPNHILNDLERKGIKYKQVTTMEEIAESSDIIYMTRYQKERFDETEYKHIAAHYRLKLDMLSKAKPTMRILHPLPRVTEISTDVDHTDHAYYFKQAENGIYAREALLALILKK